MSVRKSPPPAGPGYALTKRARVDDEDAEDPNSMTLTVASSGEGQRKNALIRTIKRTSGLEAPIVSLTGAHGGEITACKFDPSGRRLAACSVDRAISLWNTFPPHDNYGILPNVHKQAILDIAFSIDSEVIYSGGADGMLIATDLTNGERLVRYAAHYGPLNSIAVGVSGGRELVLTGGDDGIARVWDLSLDINHPVAEFDDGRDCPVTAVEWSTDGNQCFVGGVDNEIKVWDLRTTKVVYTLHGHTDTISSISLSPNGHYLATYSLDSALIIYDVRPFSSDPMRVYRSLTGAPAGFEQTLIRVCWSRHDGGARIAVGGGDRTVTVWEVETGKVLYKLPGHKGTVTGVDFHPREPIILTGSKDTNMLLGELDAQDFA
ncbi:WD40-repeat-containing domain protein [Naematelia encephala]|uniref:WD40-repeat-containing domain protein n=1 Tax=Naematelia encephala TaxID=71784 RepID=A0A1Y2BBN8_9TREE|nr:WD40-repeat-containing domain protein [Naematelia encephala]